MKKEGLHLREMAKMPSDVKQLDSEIEDVKRNWFKLTQLSSSFKNELENSLGNLWLPVLISIGDLVLANIEF